jgi:hypothetical protein
VRNSAAWAAVLSFLFPGLGQAAAGKPIRGAIVAIPAVALSVAFVLVMIFARQAFFDDLAETHWRFSIAILNLCILAYRAWAIVDAYLVSWHSQEFERSRRFRTGRAPGVTAVIVTILLAAATQLTAGAAHLPGQDPLARVSDPENIAAVSPTSHGTPKPTPTRTARPTPVNPEATPTPAIPAKAGWISANANIRVRSGAGTSFPQTGKMGRGVQLFGQIVQGSSYTVDGVTSTDWILIDAGQPFAGNYVAAGYFTAAMIAGSATDATPSPSPSPSAAQ